MGRTPPLRSPTTTATSPSTTVTITPAGGTLISHGPIVVSGLGVRIDGAVQVFGQENNAPGLSVNAGANLTSTGTVSSSGGYVAIAGTLTSPLFAMDGNDVSVAPTGRLAADTLTLDGRHVGLDVDGGGRVTTAGTPIDLRRVELNSRGGCHAALVAPVVLARNSTTQTRLEPSTLGCREYVVDGAVTLDGTLSLNTLGSPQVGDRHVLVHATGAITGTFSTVSGVAAGAGHWVVSYTRHDVVATLVAGTV